MSRTQVSDLVAAIRPARATDLPALGEFFGGLSVQTRYLRFFSPIRVGPSLLRLLGGGDGSTDALLATRDGVIIGHGMAVDVSGSCGVATTDIGVVVADAWQHRGLGSALVRALVAGAQVRDVTAVTMDVMHGNDRALAMIMGHWPAARPRRSRDGYTICVQLADPSAAAGRLEERVAEDPVFLGRAEQVADARVEMVGGGEAAGHGRLADALDHRGERPADEPVAQLGIAAVDVDHPRRDRHVAEAALG